MTQQYRLASIAARFFPTGISHHSLLPHIPSSHFFTANISPRPGIAPQSLTSAPSRCAIWVMDGCGKDCLILIPFRLPQISCFTFSLKCFSSDSDNCPDVGIRPLLQFPHLPRAGPMLLTLLFFPLVPLSYQVFRGSICFFPLVRYSCPLSAGVRHAFLCLKVYS